MKIADLYIRVSTDEQADKGYSQRSQEEVLKRYCEQNQIGVRKVIFEDHSAKTFLRPEWQKLLVNLKQYKKQVNLILFTKWDRFSRNAPDAYQMINLLKSLDVEPQAIEQPLDMSVPENKMMLAIYLTAPEIENDRRALNTFYGLRRARKEGRWTSLAPVGYINRSTPDGKKYIAPDDQQAKIMKWALNEISLAKYNTEQIFKRAKEMGLRCNKNRFLVAIRNPVYCGKIFIEKYKDEESHTVKGLHEALISESMYYQIQEILDGKKRKSRTTIMSPKMLPLKGFLHCNHCSRVLCGSASKGRNSYYYYYHCSSACGYRKKADEVNTAFVNELRQYVLNSESKDFFKAAIMDAYIDATKNETAGKTDCILEITALNNRITKARELLLMGDIDSADYKIIKNESEHKIAILEAKLAEIPIAALSLAEVEMLLDSAITKLARLDVIYCNSDTKIQREIIGSMYPEKFTFEDLQHRTAKVDFLFQLIYQINSKLCVKKRGQATVLPCLPIVAPEAGLEPATL
ncbi:recombinase family protein [Mucilaginibacter sp. cycad4]|uniref:recombinase family protein n=1 Tax=Mucilaginibacter sp. cycad4 TaxID=3342096 RepID=UPI002AAA96FA|nr:recombinase family protein [Mucilaginibacter gossypii]WPU97881.1 recombinase family protein [Mucilaginibacter gossypii]